MAFVQCLLNQLTMQVLNVGFGLVREVINYLTSFLVKGIKVADILILLKCKISNSGFIIRSYRNIEHLRPKSHGSYLQIGPKLFFDKVFNKQTTNSSLNWRKVIVCFYLKIDNNLFHLFVSIVESRIIFYFYDWCLFKFSVMEIYICCWMM